jgi:sugar phosphate isomerase/epimerase
MSARVGLQLFTVREECERDLESTLRTVRELGYDGVELFSLHGRAAGDLRALLDECGLAVAGRHVGLGADASAVADEMRTLGCDRVALAWIEPPSSIAARDDAAARIVELGARMTARGLRFGFHNHWAELRRFEDGASLLELLPEPIWLELDLGWAWYGGESPLRLLEWARGRTPLVHLKDLRSRETHEHVPVGEGGVGYDVVVPRAVELGVEWLIVEQDELDRPWAQALERSLGAVRVAA